MPFAEDGQALDPETRARLADIFGPAIAKGSGDAVKAAGLSERIRTLQSGPCATTTEKPEKAERSELLDLLAASDEAKAIRVGMNR